MADALYQRLWAKSDPNDPHSFHPLWCHLLDVAAVCEALHPRFGEVVDIPEKWLPFLAALHDIGKADARFQGKAPGLVQSGVPKDTEGKSRGFRHEARSADWMASYLREQWAWEKSAALVVAQATRGHHGDFGAEGYAESEWPEWAAFYGPVRADLAALVAEALGIQAYAAPRFADASATGMKLSGRIVLSDWIGSNPDVYRYRALPKDAQPAAYLQAAREEAKRAVRSLELDALPDALPPSRQSFAVFWPGLKDFKLRPSQQVLEDAILGGGLPPGLAIIEAPMGEGKTEAAIYLAASWRRPGLYIALPTQATGNQMHGRYRKFLEERDPSGPPPRLVHGMAWLQDGVAPAGVSQTEGEDSEERLLSREWFSNAKRALLAQDGVGTVDQVLMAALQVKHGFLRLLGLSTKTLIIDEVHAYDMYMTTLMQTLLRWCRVLDVPVILLSATLSRAQKQALAEAYGGPGALPASAMLPQDEPYPLLTFVPRAEVAFTLDTPPGSVPTRTVQIEPHPGTLGDAEAAARLAKEAVAGGGCACVLANTVRSAQGIFQALQVDPLPDTTLLLFHARFRAERRQEIEEKVNVLFGKAEGGRPNPNRPKRAILVATQVVEQSLDIDFDVMLSEIAPIDLLLQRSGRLHRHAENNPRPSSVAAPVLHLLLPAAAPGTEPDFGSMAIRRVGDEWRGVYDRAALLRTLALLENRDAFHLPADFRPLIEGCYGDAPLPVSSIAAEWITEAEIERETRRAQSRRKAEEHLVPDPSPRLFKYAQQADQPVAESEEGERASFFRAQTREGDSSRAVLILHDPELVTAMRRGVELGDEWRPGRELLRRLFLQKAALPAYWLSALTPADGYEMLDGKAEVPPRLRHHIILVMQDGRWEGFQTRRNKAGKEAQKRVIITDDQDLGLCWPSEASDEAAELAKGD